MAAQGQGPAEQGESATTTPSDTTNGQESASQEQPQEVGLQATLVKHATYQDGCTVAAGQTIIKTWSISNSGNDPFPAGTKLIFLRGDHELSLEEEFPQEISLLEAGATADVSAVLIAPSQPGRYTIYFQLADSERNVFGPRLGADLVVAEAEKEWVDVKDEKEVKEPANESAKEPVKEASAPPATNEGKYSTQLQQLTAIGFLDEKLNSQLLEMFQGDVRKVCEYLFK